MLVNAENQIHTNKMWKIVIICLKLFWILLDNRHLMLIQNELIDSAECFKLNLDYWKAKWVFPLYSKLSQIQKYSLWEMDYEPYHISLYVILGNNE